MNKRSIFAVLLGMIVALAALTARGPSAFADGQVAIIVNPSNSVSSLSLPDLQRIYTGQKSRWPDGKHILLLMSAPGSADRIVVLKTVYKMSESEYSKFFLQATFTGEISAPPQEVSSAAQIKQLVAQNQAAIGYVRPDDVDSTVKVVSKVP